MSDRDSLPFEPRRKRKKPTAKTQAESTPAPTASQPPDRPVSAKEAASLSAIPDAVSQRMIRRMAVFCGTPSVLAIGSLFAFYWIVQHDWFELPPAAAQLTSLGFFGLAVVGLSYGLVSASWDETRPGGWLGWQEFRLNFGRLTGAWREARQAKRSAQTKED
ncbi:MAG: DUF3464 family protein [Spirulinaceae cyanobacterium RM2_2_10]|nr:DUF3464 family protein [Spirulinaceae cyanobacterium SM2_1_0]NJO19449.1 DUF3464 family protein [Spirulinaceae cyanobacterium RM2_2_10]